MASDMTYCELITSHYETVWKASPTKCIWGRGPTHELPPGFCVLKFPPRQDRNMWTFATCCMSQANDSRRTELHLFAPCDSERHVELLTAVAHYNRTGESIGLWDTVNFGRPWAEESTCRFGLISLPYLDGPNLEVLDVPDHPGHTSFLWLVPITEEERDFKIQYGVESLEAKLEFARFDYLNPSRCSVV